VQLPNKPIRCKLATSNLKSSLRAYVALIIVQMHCSSGHFEHANVVATLSQLSYVSAELRSANPLFVWCLLNLEARAWLVLICRCWLECVETLDKKWEMLHSKR